MANFSKKHQLLFLQIYYNNYYGKNVDHMWFKNTDHQGLSPKV